MKKKIDTSWIHKLPELGAGLEWRTIDLEDKIKFARLKLEEAQEELMNTMLLAEKEYGLIETEVKKLWTKAEIKAAKNEKEFTL